MVGEFAKQARTTDAGELKDFTPAKRYTLLLSLIHNAKARTRDAVAGAVVKRMATIHQRAKDELLIQQFEQLERVNQLLGKFGEVINIVATVADDQSAGRQVRATSTQTGEIEGLKAECFTVQKRTGDNYLPLLWAQYKNDRSVLLRAIKAMARPADITNAIIAALIHARFELPVFPTLERLTGHVRALAHRRL